MKRTLRKALHLSRGVDVFRWLNRRGLRILMYHNFPADTHLLRRQCEHIRQCYNPVAMSAVAVALAGGEALPEKALAVTVDDGYKDFLLNAFPIFQEFSIPATVYLISGFLDGRCWPWWNRVEYGIANTAKDSVAIPPNLQVPLKTPADRKAAPEIICEHLKLLPNAERAGFIERVPEVFDIALPPEIPAQWAPLSWGEVTMLASRGVEFGAHTESHPILSQLTPAEQEHEISLSIRRLQEELAPRVLHFCYPNGRAADFNRHTLDLMRKYGVKTAVTTEPALNQANADALTLSRLGVSPDQPFDYFKEVVAGIHTPQKRTN